MFFSSYSRIKRILDQSTSQGDERGVPRIGSIGGAKTRDSAQRFTRHGAEKRPRPGDLQWRCTGDSIRICSKTTFLRLGCSRARSVLTTRTADLVLCLMNGLKSTLTYAPPVWPHPESSCRSKHSMQKCFPFLSALCPSALRYSLSVESCRACLTLPVTVLS